MSSNTSPRETPLKAVHEKLGARLIDFHGWLMPVQYEGIIKEHMAVRNHVGLFDISHMGEILVKGEGALNFLQKVMTNDFSKLKRGQALYSFICYPDGGVVDDAITLRLDDQEYLIIVNASNEEKDFNWLKKNEIKNIEIKNISTEMGLIALQGPDSFNVLEKLFNVNEARLEFFCFVEVSIDGNDLIISRTGYTGEKGVEIACSLDQTVWLWEKLMEAGEEFGITPIGLGARDTLRLEMKYPLYGNDLDEKKTPIEAGMGWAVSLEKDDFIGKEAIKALKEKGEYRKLIAFQLEDPGVPRPHYEVWNQTHQIGEVTSGTISPSLGKGLGLAYVDPGYSKIGTEIMIQVRQRQVKATVVKAPFVKSNTR